MRFWTRKCRSCRRTKRKKHRSRSPQGLEKKMFYRFWISGGSKNAVRAVPGSKPLVFSRVIKQPAQSASVHMSKPLSHALSTKSPYSPRSFQSGSCCTHQQRSMCLSRGENMFLAHPFATNNSKVSLCGVKQAHTSGTQNTLEWHHTSCNVFLCLLVIPAVLPGLFFFLVVLLGHPLLNPHLHPRPLGNLSATVRFLQVLTAASEAALPSAPLPLLVSFLCHTAFTFSSAQAASSSILLPASSSSNRDSATSFNFRLWLSPGDPKPQTGLLQLATGPVQMVFSILCGLQFLCHSHFSGRHRAHHSCERLVFRGSAILPWIFTVGVWTRGQQVWGRRGRRMQHRRGR